MIRRTVFAVMLLMVAACSQGEVDQSAVDAAVQEALAERDREDAEKYRTQQASGTIGTKELRQASGTPATTMEKLRDGLPTVVGSPYGMCLRTLSIVGEHCGCMVNRASETDISDPALVGLFGGDGKRATPNQIAAFKRIVRSCAGYNITIRGSSAEDNLAKNAPAGTTSPAQASNGERMVRCEFYTTRSNYNGPCRFLPGNGGDFRAISTEGAFSEADGIYRIDLDVTGTNVGSLIIDHGYEPYVIAVTRSQSDRACWTGAEATFCAR